MPKKKTKIVKDKTKSKFDPTPNPKYKNKKGKIRLMHHSYLKKVILTDVNKPNGVIENPFIVKNRSISNRVNSIIVGIQQPIIKMLNLTADTYYKQWCDPVTKTICLEVYDYEKEKANADKEKEKAKEVEEVKKEEW